MPLMKKRTMKKGRKPRRARQFGAPRRVLRARGTSQVFSETYKAGTECAGINAQGEVFIAAGSAGQGVKLVAQMNRLSQIASYSTLWNAYKIVKAKFTIVPKFSAEQFNEAAIGTSGGIGIKENTTLAYAINDYAEAITAPLAQLDVLQDNGCKLKSFVRPTVITVRPKPLVEQQITGAAPGTNVNVYQNRGQWIEFDQFGATVPHVGVDAWFNAYNSLTAGFIAIADVYVTLSFVCRDPR